MHGSEDELAPVIHSAQAAFLSFTANAAKNSRITIFHDVDADGVAAAVVLLAALQRTDYSNVTRWAPGRARNAWSEESRAIIHSSQPAVLFVLDLGSRSEPVLPGVPTCFIDHHRPNGCPPSDLLISGYGWDPTPTTSMLVHWMAESLTDVSDLEWVTALGIISDVGEKAPFELLKRAKKAYTAKWLKEATTLVNAARRASIFDPEAAVRAILKHSSPKQLVMNDEDDDIRQLKEARREVQAALAEGKKTPPLFAGKIALIRLRSPCQIHPLIAQIWRSRLPKHVVIAANEGYIPERVNFSARSSGDVSAIDVLRSYTISEGEGIFGQGHEQASGGSLPYSRWNELLAQMGFGPEAFAIPR